MLNSKQTSKKICEIGPNELIGEMAFFTKEPRSATVEAIVQSTLYELDTFNFEVYFKKQPEWLKVLIKALVAKVKNSNENISSEQ